MRHNAFRCRWSVAGSNARRSRAVRFRIARETSPYRLASRRRPHCCEAIRSPVVLESTPSNPKRRVLRRAFPESRDHRADASPATDPRGFAPEPAAPAACGSDNKANAIAAQTTLFISACLMALARSNPADGWIARNRKPHGAVRPCSRQRFSLNHYVALHFPRRCHASDSALIGNPQGAVRPGADS